MLDAGWVETSQTERRQSNRRRTRLTAMIVVNNGWSTYNAVVLNKSIGGALLDIGAPMLIPMEFKLSQLGQLKPARRVWTRLNLVGIAFLD